MKVVQLFVNGGGTGRSKLYEVEHPHIARLESETKGHAKLLRLLFPFSILSSPIMDLV